VVPSVAIREGVLKNIEITAEHFRALYNNLPFEHFVYDARKVKRIHAGTRRPTTRCTT
jgi:type III restriction enzyme